MGKDLPLATGAVSFNEHRAQIEAARQYIKVDNYLDEKFAETLTPKQKDDLINALAFERVLTREGDTSAIDNCIGIFSDKDCGDCHICDYGIGY